MSAPQPAPAPDGGGGHAVVIGASVAGLLAACVLGDRYGQVTVIDRDELPTGPAARRGVPQSRQAHALLARGAEALDELLPGFTGDLLAAGAAFRDMQQEFSWYLDGYRIRPRASGLTAIGATRRLIEHTIRTRVAALPRVQIVDATEVLGVITSPGRERVVGVRVRGRGEAGPERELDAELVVDASGRGSRARLWLQELGYPVPPQSQVRADVVYVTRHYRRAPEESQKPVGAAVMGFPGHPRGGIVIEQENDQRVVMLAGMLGVEPPTDDAGMLAYADTLCAPEVANFIRSAQPLDEAVKMRFPASERQHFDKLDRLLDGYLVTGDALCSFNPVYGQGMTVAALEALALRSVLAKGTEQMPRRFFRATGKLIDVAWSMSVAGDLRFPEVVGRRTVIDGLLERYLGRYRAAASVDPGLGTTFLRVANMSLAPIRLLTPAQIFRVFRAARKATRPAPVER